MAVDRAQIFDIMYALAAKDGRSAALFGSGYSVVCEAFSRSLVGNTFPEIWFEIPLAGQAWFDFHALVAYDDIAGTQAEFAGQSGVYAQALQWFASQQQGKVRQLALSYDTHNQDVAHPAVQVLVSGSDIAVPLGFLESVDAHDAKDSFCAFIQAKPEEWFACYVGVFPGRQESATPSWVRVECIVGDNLQRAYAEDPSMLRSHLEAVGMNGIDESAYEHIQVLAKSPFPLELQFNVGPTGAVLPVVSASVRFQPEDWANDEQKQHIARLAYWMQTQGLADNRCALLADTVYATRVAHDNESIIVSCIPAFVKLRYSKGKPASAKAYLLGRVEQKQ